MEKARNYHFSVLLENGEYKLSRRCSQVAAQQVGFEHDKDLASWDMYRTDTCGCKNESRNDTLTF